MEWKFPGFAFQPKNGHTSVFCSKGGLVIQHSENIHMCTRYITHIIYKPGNPKTASTVFLVITVMHFVWAHAAFDVFNQYMILVWILLNQKCWEIVALVWLWRQDRGHTWPYMARHDIWHDQFLLVILKVQFLVALDRFSSMTFFWNDQDIEPQWPQERDLEFPGTKYMCVLYMQLYVTYISCH